MTQLSPPLQREGRQVGSGQWTPASVGRGASRPTGAPVGVRPPSSLQGRCRGLEGLSRPGEGTSRGGVPPPTLFPSPTQEQPWDFLPRERPWLIHPGAFEGTFLL